MVSLSDFACAVHQLFCVPHFCLAMFRLFILKCHVLLVLALAATGALAETGMARKAGLLGMSRTQVEQSLADVQAVRSTRRLASGATSQLMQADVLYEGVHFEQTFFFTQQKLTEIELLSLPESTSGASTSAASDRFAALLAALKTELGPELAAGDSAFWVHGDANIVLYRYEKSGRPSIRLVIRRRQQVDASTL